MDRPIIAVPMGDPAGVGPEIVIRALSGQTVNDAAKCVCLGDARVLERALRYPKMPRAEIKLITDPADGDYRPGAVNVMDLKNVDMDSFRVGEVSGMCGRAAYEYIAAGVDLCLSGRALAAATTPINKESLRAGGVPYIGHTEIFGALTGTPDPLTMFEVRSLRVFFLTRHLSLRDAIDGVRRERIVDYVIRCERELERLGVKGGPFAVAGLNPHCGEHGLFGDEEVREVAPAVEELRGLGYEAEGPVGADSVFWQALQGKYRAVLSLYHDQGHIAAKTVDFYRTISLTLGMPILRTSVDHGTAFDAAGSGSASAVSMEEAILAAAKYAPSYSRGAGHG